MADPKNRAYEITDLSSWFNQLDGYYDLDSRALLETLLSWNLLEEKNTIDPVTVISYMKWSFTASFLKLINAWQWFLAGILLSRQALMPAQIMQMYYYSIFFSYSAFLSAHFKGGYTVKIDYDLRKEFYDWHRTRKVIWLEEEKEQPQIIVRDQSGRGEHEITANWFYQLFSDWDLKGKYPDELAFAKEHKWHVYFRNFYTYALEAMADELSIAADYRHTPSSDTLIDLWNRDKDSVFYFPEEFWALEHLKVVTNLHSSLLDGYDKDSPYTDAQVALVRGLYDHHCETGLVSLLEVALEPIFKSLQ